MIPDTPAEAADKAVVDDDGPETVTVFGVTLYADLQPGSAAADARRIRRALADLIRQREQAVIDAARAAAADGPRGVDGRSWCLGFGEGGGQ